MQKQQKHIIREPFCAGNCFSWELRSMDVGILTQEVPICKVLLSPPRETQCRRNASSLAPLTSDFS